MTDPRISLPRVPDSRQHYINKYQNFCYKFGRTQKLKGDYLECHRIFPGALGGKYEDGNTIYLTRREHTIAHMLLAKAFPNCFKLVNCAWRMVPRKGTKLYDSFDYHQKMEEKRDIIAQSNRNRKNDHGPKVSAALLGKPKTQEHVENIRKSRGETLDNMSEAEKKAKFGANKGVKPSPSSNAKRAETIRNQKWYYKVVDGVKETCRTATHPGGDWLVGRGPR